MQIEKIKMLSVVMMKKINIWYRRGLTVLVLALHGLFLLPNAAMADTALMPLPKEVMVNDVEFILIPEGWFYKTGGILKPGDEERFHDPDGGGNVKIWLDSYYIAKYEARARDLVKYLNSDIGKPDDYEGKTTSCSVGIGSDRKYFEIRPTENLPATHISWEMADRWSRWMGFRLLLETEWEKAARGDDLRLYPWGGDYPDETYAGFKIWSNCFTWPVDSFLKGRSPYGVFNMAGNIREFVADWYSAEYDADLKDGARNPTPPMKGTTRPLEKSRYDVGPWKMVKGGRWASNEDQLLIGGRVYPLPDDPFQCNGTRFAIDVATVRERLANGSATVITP